MTALASPSAVLLEVTDLRTSYGAHVAPVRGVSFTLARGESLGIVGESGSGKSVLLRSLVGVHPRTGIPSVSGSVQFDGQDLLGADDRTRHQILGKRIGYIHQDPLTSLHPLARAGDQILLSPRLHGERRSRAEERALVEQMLRAVGFSNPREIARKYPHEMSGGQRQRVGIAAAVVQSPQLLCADEPTTALDVTVQSQVLDLLARLRAEHGSALILVSHDLGVVADRCDRIAVMYGGRIVETASARVLLREAAHPYTVGLLKARPRLTGPNPRRLRAIPGTAAPPSRPVEEGCPFAPRCPLADSRCVEQLPPLVTRDNGAAVACWKSGEGLGNDV